MNVFRLQQLLGANWPLRVMYVIYLFLTKSMATVHAYFSNACVPLTVVLFVFRLTLAPPLSSPTDFLPQKADTDLLVVIDSPTVLVALAIKPGSAFLLLYI